MPRNRLGYVNRSALIEREQSMATSSMTASNQGRAAQAPTRSGDVNCRPMSHQNSGDHGHEMYPQQFVRLVGCHDVPMAALRKRQDEKLH